MKKRLIALAILLSLAVSMIFGTGCYFDNDFYGVYFNQEGSVWLTLKEDNFASLVIGETVETYYAEYLIGENTINLRDEKDGNWGKIKRVIRINPDNVEELTLVRSALKVDADGNDYLDVEGVPDVVLVLDRNY